MTEEDRRWQWMIFRTCILRSKIRFRLGTVLPLALHQLRPSQLPHHQTVGCSPQRGRCEAPELGSAPSSNSLTHSTRKHGREGTEGCTRNGQHIVPSNFPPTRSPQLLVKEYLPPPLHQSASIHPSTNTTRQVRLHGHTETRGSKLIINSSINQTNGKQKKAIPNF